MFCQFISICEWTIKGISIIINKLLLYQYFLGCLMKKMEIWADSFHEGEWFLTNLSPFCKIQNTNYIYGFIPSHTLQITESINVNFTVFGSYKSWGNLPAKIEKLLDYGKPDIIIYDRDSDTIVLAIEETAAVPTGNQALQRCERIFGSAYLKTPFSYLLPEYGIHTDGQNRRTSIWPTLLALKLSIQFGVPSVSFMYSDSDNPEDYHKGTGLKSLFEYSYLQIKKHLNLLDENEKNRLKKVLSDQISLMCTFIVDQYTNIINYLPSVDQLRDQNFVDALAQKILDKRNSGNLNLDTFLNWPCKKDIGGASPLLGHINKDSFLSGIDTAVENNNGYVISQGVGSKPQSKESIDEWLLSQAKQSNKINIDYSCPVKSFLKTENGNYHITTSKNITYFIDNIAHLDTAFHDAFPKRKFKLSDLLSNHKDLPSFLYVSNSLKPNRIFGDPFTGQFATFSNLFCFTCSYERYRSSIIYLPYVSAGCFYDNSNTLVQNKGLSIYLLLADIIICNNGYVISMMEKGRLYA